MDLAIGKVKKGIKIFAQEFNEAVTKTIEVVDVIEESSKRITSIVSKSEVNINSEKDPETKSSPTTINETIIFEATKNVLKFYNNHNETKPRTVNSHHSNDMTMAVEMKHKESNESKGLDGFK